MRRSARKSKILPMIYRLRYQILGYGQDFRKLYLLDLVKHLTDIQISFGVVAYTRGSLYPIFKKKQQYIQQKKK